MHYPDDIIDKVSDAIKRCHGRLSGRLVRPSRAALEALSVSDLERLIALHREAEGAGDSPTE